MMQVIRFTRVCVPGHGLCLSLSVFLATGDDEVIERDGRTLCDAYSNGHASDLV